MACKLCFYIVPHLDFNLYKLQEGARPESSLASAAATNPTWLVGGC